MALGCGWYDYLVAVLGVRDVGHYVWFSLKRAAPNYGTDLMRVFWAAVLVFFTLVCWLVAAAALRIADVRDVVEVLKYQDEALLHPLLARLLILTTTAPATLVVGPVVGWAGFAMKRSWVTWLAFGLVAVHALAVVETLRQLSKICSDFARCLGAA